jgi:hypothetical protein
MRAGAKCLRNYKPGFILTGYVQTCVQKFPESHRYSTLHLDEIFFKVQSTSNVIICNSR